jgi:hypothetical protein
MATDRFGDALDATYECVTLHGVARTATDDDEFNARLRQLLADVFAHCRTTMPTADAAGVCLTLCAASRPRPRTPASFGPPSSPGSDGLL